EACVDTHGAVRRPDLAGGATEQSAARRRRITGDCAARRVVGKRAAADRDGGHVMTGTDAESHTQEGREQQLVDAVIASLASTPDQRLKTVLTALVEHLHAFNREVRLTARECQTAM